ncbi:retinal-binding protein [Patella vulgata]|uniref:retinal-binding protein n=1 Tax=Patella vulgata TaxID=6465 RepID=UPI002180632F|nr:retinal-binding protein [Patella vulgata]
MNNKKNKNKPPCNDKSKRREEKEEQILQEFKNKIQDSLPPNCDDLYLKKWLKARRFDVKKAEDMYRASHLTRKKLGVNTILDNYKPPEVLEKYLTGGLCGHDKEGSPVRIELYGKLDMKGLMYSAKKIDMEKTKLLQCEEIVQDWKEQSVKLGRHVDQLTVIFDMTGVSTKMLWKPGLQMYLHLVKVLEDNYPEMMKRMFVVNAPAIFPLLYKICRPLVSDDMKNKIHVLGDDYKDVLLKYIDTGELPGFLGGNKTDPDGNPRCTSWICQGGEVPVSYYLKDTENFTSLQTMIVPNGETVNFTYNITEPGTVISWEFQTEGYDIGFGVFYLKDGKQISVVAMERVNSHMVPQDGNLSCQEIGTYIVCFDNTFSWTRSKTVKYRVEVIVNDEELKGEINEMNEDRALTEDMCL